MVRFGLTTETFAGTDIPVCCDVHSRCSLETIVCRCTAPGPFFRFPPPSLLSARGSVSVWSDAGKRTFPFIAFWLFS